MCSSDLHPSIPSSFSSDLCLNGRESRGQTVLSNGCVVCVCLHVCVSVYVCVCVLLRKGIVYCLSPADPLLSRPLMQHSCEGPRHWASDQQLHCKALCVRACTRVCVSVLCSHLSCCLMLVHLRSRTTLLPSTVL